MWFAHLVYGFSEVLSLLETESGFVFGAGGARLSVRHSAAPSFSSTSLGVLAHPGCGFRLDRVVESRPAHLFQRRSLMCLVSFPRRYRLTLELGVVQGANLFRLPQHSFLFLVGLFSLSGRAAYIDADSRRDCRLVIRISRASRRLQTLATGPGLRLGGVVFFAPSRLDDLQGGLTSDTWWSVFGFVVAFLYVLMEL